jgi:hypothetical protein
MIFFSKYLVYILNLFYICNLFNKIENTMKRYYLMCANRSMLKTAMIILIVTWGTMVLSQEQKPHKVNGGMGYFITGYSFNDYSGLNALFNTSGYPELKNGAMSFGCGGYVIQ